MTTAGSLLDAAREAYEHKAWADAFEKLDAADADIALGAKDLERLAVSAYLLGRDAECEVFWERAHHQWIAEDDVRAAVRCAFWVSFGMLLRGDMAQAGGWLSRGQRLLDESEHGDCAERGYLLIPNALGAYFGGELHPAIEMFERVQHIGEACHDPDLTVFGKHGLGQAVVAIGDVARGIGLLDEVMVDVTTEAVSPQMVGLLYCAVIETCRDIFDIRRAHEWTGALTRWCASQPDLVPYRGNCLVHRAEILQLHGDWPDAVQAAERARDWMLDPPGPAIGNAYYQLGELHRLRGEYDAAEADYRSASQQGHDPQPGMALLRLAQGQVNTAVASINRALDEMGNPLQQPKLLAAYVDVMLAAGDVGAARTAADSLTGIAESRDAPLLQAIALHATGSVLLAEDDAKTALGVLRRAWNGWQEIGAPYDAALAREQIALACRAVGDEDAAQMEFDAARWAFDQLGAMPDLARVDELAGRTRRPARAGGLTLRETEVLRLVATGKTNRAIATDLFLSEKTVARHVANIFTKLDVSSRSAATAYAYEHDLV